MTRSTIRSARAPSRHALLVGLAAATALAVFGGAGGATGPRTAQAADSTGGGAPLLLLGLLPGPADAGETIPAVTTADHRLYKLGYRAPQYVVTEYDLNSRVPTLIRSAGLGTNQLGFVTPYSSFVDEKRHRLVFFTDPQPAFIVVDLVTLKITQTVSLTASLGGLAVIGVMYAPQDDRVYVMGSLNGTSLVNNVDSIVGGGAPTLVAAVEALRADDYSAIWTAPVPQCIKPLNTYAVGGLIARAQARPVLYFACARTRVYPGESGVARIFITAGATQADTGQFLIQYFPISGVYDAATAGVLGDAVFDPRSERVFLHSLAKGNPGAWVFDGLNSGWAGFVSLPDSSGGASGLQPSNGHYYLGSGGNGDVAKGYLLVADGRSTPVPQGTVFRHPYHVQNSRQVYTDPGSRRLFVGADLGVMGLGPAGQTGLVVLEDRTPDARPPRPVDYDARTMDVVPGPNTTVTAAGDVSGYGAHVTLVGGYGGLLCVNPGLTGDCASDLVTVPNFSPGDRGLYASRVPSLDLRKVGASASAEAYALDPLSTSDLGQMHDKVTSTAGPTAGAAVDWKWPPAVCLDAAGRATSPHQESATGDTADAACDLGGERASAAAVSGRLALLDLDVAGTSISAQADGRAPAMLATATATVTGARLSIPGGGELRIGHLRTHVTASAGGRPGTAKSVREVAMSAARITSATGTVLYECTAADTCNLDAAVSVLNQQFGTHVTATAPRAELVTTPRGAFASVGKSDADAVNDLIVNDDASRAVPALQIELFNDGVQRSRVLVQLGALGISAIRQLGVLPVILPDVAVDCSPCSTTTATVHSSLPVVAAQAVLDRRTHRRASRGQPPRLAGHGWEVLVRHPREALLLGSICLVFLVAAMVVRQRARLLRSVGAS